MSENENSAKTKNARSSIIDLVSKELVHKIQLADCKYSSWIQTHNGPRVSRFDVCFLSGSFSIYIAAKHCYGILIVFVFRSIEIDLGFIPARCSERGYDFMLFHRGPWNTAL